MNTFAVKSTNSHIEMEQFLILILPALHQATFSSQPASFSLVAWSAMAVLVNIQPMLTSQYTRSYFHSKKTGCPCSLLISRPYFGRQALFKPTGFSQCWRYLAGFGNPGGLSERLSEWHDSTDPTQLWYYWGRLILIMGFTYLYM